MDFRCYRYSVARDGDYQRAIWIRAVNAQLIWRETDCVSDARRFNHRHKRNELRNKHTTRSVVYGLAMYEQEPRIWIATDMEQDFIVGNSGRFLP